MPQYIMEGKDAPSFQALDEFTQGYIEAMFWTEEGPGVTTRQWLEASDHVEGTIPGDVGFYDLGPNTLARILGDCQTFQKTHAALLQRAYDGSATYTESSAGHDLWLTRNHHGAGFWDRGLGEVGKALTDAAHGLSTVEAYLGDDAKVYIMGAE